MRRSTSGYVTNVDKVRNYKDVLADVKVGLVNFFEEQLTALEWVGTGALECSTRVPACLCLSMINSFLL